MDDSEDCSALLQVLVSSHKMLIEHGLWLIIVSAETKQECFTKSIKDSLPWPHMSFDDINRRITLARHDDISCFPSLVIVDPFTGLLINKDGRQSFLRDQTCRDFPWRSDSFDDIIGEDFIAKNMKVEVRSSWKGILVGLFFGASWCAGSSELAVLLEREYNKIQADNVNRSEENKQRLEIIAISCDEDDQAFRKFRQTMSFLAIPAKHERGKDLMQFAGVEVN